MDQEVPLSPSEAETSWLDYYEIAYRKRTRFFYVRKVGVDCSKPKSKSILHCISPEMQNYGGARGMRTSRVGVARSTLGKISRESLRLSSCPRTLSTLRGRVLNDSNRPDRCIFMSSNSRR